MSQSTDRRSHRWTEHKARRRDEVLDAAVAAVDEGGVDVTVAQIADRVGLPRPVVYRHFDGRKDLDEQIRRRILRRLLAELLPTLQPDGTVRQAVQHAIGSYVRWVHGHPNLHRFLGTGSHHEGPADSPAVSGARTAIGTQVAALFATAVRDYDVDPALARPMAFGVLGLVDGAVNGWRSDPGSSLTAADVAAGLTESVIALIEANARRFGVPITADTPVMAVLTSSSVEVG